MKLLFTLRKSRRSTESFIAYFGSMVPCHVSFARFYFFSEEKFLVMYVGYPVFQDDMEDDECLAEFK